MRSSARGCRLALVATGLGLGCDQREPAQVSEYEGPMAYATAADVAGVVGNREAAVPPMCYTRTGGESNPCWTCHTRGVGRNRLDDSELQEAYAFSETALENHWTNLFVDRRPFLAAVSDAEILRWVRGDNYAPLRRAMQAMPPAYRGFRPDLDLARGMDGDGFAADGSGWRAVRFQPFPGAFWPTNGSTSDLFVRLPDSFRRAADGAASREVYRLNLSLLEAAISVEVCGAKRVDREVEPIDERLIAFDLDGDGAIRPGTTRIRRLPPHYGAPRRASGSWRKRTRAGWSSSTACAISIPTRRPSWRRG